MSINGFDKDSFGLQLSEVVFPSRPIISIQHLMGRDEELETIERALYQAGRHIFIFGDRGVGKSSLGATAAYQYQASGAEPIFVAGSVDDTFKSVIANIANQALGRSRLEATKRQENIGVEWRGLKWGSGVEISTIEVASQIQTVGDATELLKQVAERHSQKSIVVVDEFDAIGSVEERNKFASLLKQLGDQSVNLKFIFTGIGETLDELLGAHPSAFRQLETVQLFRLSWEGRREIVTSAAEAFGLSVDDNVSWRIAIVSDGFPYYVQLITEKMLWEAFADPVIVEQMGPQHYQLGLRKAIQSINAELKRPYERAVLHREQEFETVVWATADGEDLYRNLRDMHESYRVVFRKAEREGEPLPQTKFTEQVRKLKSKGFGEILQPVEKRPGWYTYKEKMLRGFVRMQAEANGIELSGEKEAPRQRMHVPGNARTGYRGSSIPKGVRVNVGRNEVPDD